MIEVARPLSETEWHALADGPMAQVFASDDAFDEPFAAAVEHRALLFPFAKRLEPAQLAALGLAAATVGDDAFLLTGAIAEEEPRWLIPFSRGPVYQDLKVMAGTTLLSPSGRWGFRIADDDHGVVGGPAAFMAVLLERIPPTEHPTRHFIAAREPGEAAGPSRQATEPRGTEIPIETGYAAGDDQVRAFLRHYEIFRALEVNPGTWMPGLLRHVLGEEHAERLMAEEGWRDALDG